MVADRTGLSQDVLRIWERRYAAVQPQRGRGGQRLYTDRDVERLTLLHAATRAGRSIGQIARLSTDAIAALVDGDAAARDRRAAATIPVVEARDVVSDALALTRTLEGGALDEALRRAATGMGMSAFLETVAGPFLQRVGDEWHAGRLTPAHEHLASSILHDIVVETMRAFTPQDGAPKMIVATPATERHVMGAALVGATAALAGWNVVYLGADLPATEIADAARVTHASLVALSIVHVENRTRVLEEMRTLRARLPEDVALVVGGAGAVSLTPKLSAMGIRVEPDVLGLLALLRHREAQR